MTTETPVVLGAHALVVERSTSSRRFKLSVSLLELHRGEALAVIGANGAGKTTLLLALAGLLNPLSGAIGGDGRAVTMVFQRPLPFAGSVATNVRIALLGKGLSKGEIERRVEIELDRFGLGSLRDQSAGRLSGGELRRLALARGMALAPDVLLLDEPFDDLDVDAQSRLEVDLSRLVRDTGVALAFVTHDLRRASGLADRLAVLRQGRLEQIGPTVEILEQPVNAEVAELVGMSNLLPGVVGLQSDEGGIHLSVGDGRTLRSTTCFAEGTEVWVGFRPERLKLDMGRGESAPIGEARVVALAADSLLMQVTLDWKGLELKTHLLSGRGPSRGLSRGDVVRLSLQPGDVHLMRRP